MILRIEYDPNSVMAVEIGRLTLHLASYVTEWPVLVSIDDTGRRSRERGRYRLTLSRHGTCKLSRTLAD